MASVWTHNGKIVVKDGKVILCDHCPCVSCQGVGLSVKDEIPGSVNTDDPQYYRCEPIGPFDFDGWIHIEGYVDDDFRIKIGDTSVYSGTALGHDFSKTFTFKAGNKIEIELVEAYYLHHPTGSGGPIACSFSGSIVVCPAWIDKDEYFNSAEFE